MTPRAARAAESEAGHPYRAFHVTPARLRRIADLAATMCGYVGGLRGFRLMHSQLTGCRITALDCARALLVELLCRNLLDSEAIGPRTGGVRDPDGDRLALALMTKLLNLGDRAFRREHPTLRRAGDGHE